MDRRTFNPEIVVSTYALSHVQSLTGFKAHLSRYLRRLRFSPDQISQGDAISVEGRHEVCLGELSLPDGSKETVAVKKTRPTASDKFGNPSFVSTRLDISSRCSI